MFGKIVAQFKAVRGWFKSGVQVPQVGPILPIDTQIGVHKLVLHADGRIEGDIEAVEHYLRNFSTSAFVEDRMLFWLFLQWWRQQKEMEKLIKDMQENQFAPDVEEDLDQVEAELKPVPVYEMFEDESITAPKEVKVEPGVVVSNISWAEYEKYQNEFHANSGTLVIEEKPVEVKKTPKREKTIMTAKGPVTVKYEH